jgi:hypothetical protein
MDPVAVRGNLSATTRGARGSALNAFGRTPVRPPRSEAQTAVHLNTAPGEVIIFCDENGSADDLLDLGEAAQRDAPREALQHFREMRPSAVILPAGSI